MSRNQNQNNDFDDCCDCNCDCNDCCDCGQCCGDDCQCEEFGCDCFNTINTNCFEGCACCQCCACCTSGDILTELNFNRHFDEEEESEQLIKQFEDLISKYRMIKKLSHKLYGDVYLLQLKVPTTNMAHRLYLKTIWYQQHDLYQRDIRLWSSITLHLQNENIIKVQGVYGCKIPDICIDRWRICLLIQKSHQANKKHPFNLINFILKCAQGLDYLHQINSDNFKEASFMHPDRMQYLDNSEYLVIPPYLDFTTAQSVFEQFKNQKLNLLPPPEWMENDKQEFDWWKADVWLLAIFGIKRFFNAEDLDNMDKLKVYLTKLKQKANYAVFLTIQNMLDPSPESRIDLSKVIQQMSLKDNSLIDNELGQSRSIPIASYIHRPPMIQAEMPQTSISQAVSVNNSAEPNGAKYSGQKINNEKHGQGTYILQDGSGYSGNWKRNKMHGKGVLFSAGNVKIYEGEFYEDKFHGFGYQYNNDRSQLFGSINYKDLNIKFWTKYEGDFKMDKRHGYGILYFSNGDKWAGEFKQDLPDGFGTFYRKVVDQQGQQIGITYQDDKIEGKWKQGILLQ